MIVLICTHYTSKTTNSWYEYSLAGDIFRWQRSENELHQPGLSCHFPDDNQILVAAGSIQIHHTR